MSSNEASLGLTNWTALSWPRLLALLWKQNLGDTQEVTNTAGIQEISLDLIRCCQDWGL